MKPIHKSIAVGPIVCNRGLSLLDINIRVKSNVELYLYDYIENSFPIEFIEFDIADLVFDRIYPKAPES